MRALTEKEMLLVSGGTSLLSTKTLPVVQVVATAESGGSLSGFNGLISGIAPVPISVVGGRTVPLSPLPNRQMTPMEILDYLEGQGWSTAGAVTETVVSTLADVALAAKVGSGIGTELNNLIVQYDPSLETAIGGTEAIALQNIDSALDDFSNGNIVRGLNILFGGTDTLPQQTDAEIADIWLSFV